jgi:diguanylate cyclase (GGDEF)-like protein
LADAGCVPRHQLRPPARLFAVYAALSAVPVVALGAVLDQTYRDEAHLQGVARGQEQAAVIEEMAVSPTLSGEDLRLGLSDDERGRLSAATDLAVYQGSVLRLRLRDFDGRVVFSDDGTSDFAVPVTSLPFREALVGRTHAEVVTSNSIGRSIQVLRPVVTNASGRSTGVLELYLPYDEIAAAVDAQVARAWARLAIGLVLLYAVLAAISWSTSRSLRRHAAQREHEALHDSLTGLPNRSLFQERAELACARASEDVPAAVVLIDLDRFKHVNDTLGHHAGDELLKVVAHRLTNGLRTDDTVARLGGDEFGLVLPSITDEASALALLEELSRQLGAELQIEGVALTVEASIGVALVPQHGRDVETLLKRADDAMYRGKRSSRSVVLAEAISVPCTPHPLALLSEVRAAMERDELALHYQPKIALATGQTVALEALVRWEHPERGLLAPDEFLPGVERSDLMGPFTTWVLRRALRDLAEWAGAGRPWSVAVNVSTRNLETAGFVSEVVALLAEHDVPASSVILEITETALAADGSALTEAVHDLAALGIRVSVDDFGTGWSSLSQLRSLPVAEVKIDRSFVCGLDDHPQDRALVRSVVDLAHGLSCRVTAEGVESQAIADWLAEIGCDEAQGFLWSRPVPWRSLALATDSAHHPALPAPRGSTAYGGTSR